MSRGERLSPNMATSTDGESELLSRVEDAVGPAAATMFVERGRDRHFIVETALAGVALYLLGKYLDGFIEGIGIPDLGRRHGRAVRDAAEFGLGLARNPDDVDREKLRQHTQTLSIVVVDLRQNHASNEASAIGEAGVAAILEGHDIPEVDAQRIAEEIAEATWRR